jgi:uncharacterized protein Yka (UPF0111/DUF47 family)
MDLNALLTENGIAVVVIFAMFVGISYFGKWFLNIYTHKLATNFSELLREIVEIKSEVLESNNKLYGITEKLISNQREIQEDVNAIESSLDTLLKFIKTDK